MASARTLIHVAAAAAVFAAAGALATLPFVLASESPGDSASMLVPAATVSAGLLGAMMWRLVVVGGGPGWRGAAAGALTGLGAHPLMWAILGLGVGAEVGMPAGDLATGTVASAMFFSVFSMVIYGPFTAALGALVGWGLGRALTGP